MIRLLDILFSFFGLLVLSPFLIIIAVWIVLDSPGGAFFNQTRVGKSGREFKLHKFRTMRPDSEGKGQLTVGMRDPRITSIGHFLRAYKLDELPQLLNVLKGHMSLVGPRPEVPKYVALYSDHQRKVLSVKPGITDEASLQYFRENELLAQSDDPEKTYIEEIMPAKIGLNMDFVEQPSISAYFSVIFRTLLKIVR